MPSLLQLSPGWIAETSSSSRDASRGPRSTTVTRAPNRRYICAELQRDVAATDDDETVGHRVEFEDLDTLVRYSTSESPRDVGHHRATSDVEVYRSARSRASPTLWCADPRTGRGR